MTFIRNGGMSRLLALVALGAVAVLLVSAGPTAAKDGVVARLVTAIPRNSDSGTNLTIVFTLSYVEAGRRHPFGAGSVFIRLFGADGARSPRVFARQSKTGRYGATVAVPRGGVRKVVVGLMGIRCDGPGSPGCVAAPQIFPIAGKVYR